jgi:hypothetical protein
MLPDPTVFGVCNAHTRGSSTAIICAPASTTFKGSNQFSLLFGRLLIDCFFFLLIIIPFKFKTNIFIPLGAEVTSCARNRSDW